MLDNFAAYIQQMTVTQSSLDVSEIGFGRKFLPNNDLTVNLYAMLPPDDKLLSCFEHLLGESSHYRFLGNGAVCQHCGTTFVVGILECSQCNSNDILYSHECQEKENNSIITSYSIDDLGALGSLSVNVEMILTEPFNYQVDWNDFSKYSLFGCVTEWLCMRCGLFVDRDRITCPGCGGNKLSEREVSSLRRNCIYCGEETLGGFACSKCNGRLRPN